MCLLLISYNFISVHCLVNLVQPGRFKQRKKKQVIISAHFFIQLIITNNYYTMLTGKQKKIINLALIVIDLFITCLLYNKYFKIMIINH